MSESEVHLIETKRGGHMVLYKHHLYRRNKSVRYRTYFRCNQFPCKAKLIFNKHGVLAEALGEHTHAPNIQKITRMAFDNKLKSRCQADSSAPLSKLYKEELLKFAQSAEVASCLPDITAASKFMQRAKTLALKKKENSGSSVEKKKEATNSIINEEVVIPDVETVCDSLETKKSGSSKSLVSNSDILIKQEIIEMEEEPSFFDDSSLHSPLVGGSCSKDNLPAQMPCTTYLTQSKSSNSKPNIHSVEQVQHDSTDEIECDVSTDSGNGSCEYNDTLSNVQAVTSILNVTCPENSSRREYIQHELLESTVFPVLNGCGSESSTSNESSHHRNSVLNAKCSKSSSRRENIQRRFTSDELESTALPVIKGFDLESPSVNESTQYRVYSPVNDLSSLSILNVSSLKCPTVNGSNPPWEVNPSFSPSLNVTSSESSSSNDPVQSGSLFHKKPAVSSQVFNNSHQQSSSINKSIQPAAPFQSGPTFPSRDKFDSFGEFIASKLRKLDPKSSNLVQTLFEDIIFKAESGMLLNGNVASVAVATTKNNDFPKHISSSNESENNLSSSKKKNEPPKVPFPRGMSDIADHESSMRNQATQPIFSPHVVDQSISLVLNRTGPERSLPNESIHSNNPSPLSDQYFSPVLSNTASGSTLSDESVLKSHTQNPSYPGLNTDVSKSRFPFHGWPRDEFDAYGEFAAKTNKILQSVKSVNKSELNSLEDIVTNLCKHPIKKNKYTTFTPAESYASEVPLEIITKLHSIYK